MIAGAEPHLRFNELQNIAATITNTSSQLHKRAAITSESFGLQGSNALATELRCLNLSEQLVEHILCGIHRHRLSARAMPCY